MTDGFAISAGSVDITPLEPIPLAGYATLRKSSYERVADPLEVNIAILRAGSQLSAFISFDLMYVGAYLRDAMVAALDGLIPREAIFTSAIHTHSGPPTEDSLPVLGKVTPAYREMVAEKAAALALKLLNGVFVPVALEYLEGSASHSINRRTRTFGVSRNFPFLGQQVNLKPNPAGVRDETLRVLRVRDADGRAVLIAWCYACHPVGYPQLNDLTAEYPGAVRAQLRAELGDIPVIFWQGFSGNIGPRQLVREPGAEHATYSLKATSLDEWHKWAGGLGAQVSATAAAPEARIIGGPVSCALRALPLRELGLDSDKQLRLHEIRLGSELVICGLNAEVAVEYVATLQKLYAPARVIPVGCVGDVYGYLPVDQMVREGGYEARGFIPRFGLRGRFVPNIEAVVTERLFPRPDAARSEAQRPATHEGSAGVVERGSDRPASTRAVDV